MSNFNVENIKIEGELLLTSPNGNVFSVVVDNIGNLSTIKKFVPYIIEIDTTITDGSDTETIVFAVDGPYDFVVDWGDDDVEEYSGTNQDDISHVYDTGGVYDVKISGFLNRIVFYEKDSKKLTKINQWGNIRWGSFESSYRDCFNLEIVATDVPDLENVNNMELAFSSFDFEINRRGIKFSSSISDWDVSNVTNMRALFEGSQIDKPLNNWDVSNVTNMREMFADTLYNQPLDNWDVSNVTNMSGMFLSSAFNQPIDNWNVGNVTSFLSFVANTDLIFDAPGVTGFNQPLNSWDVSGATDMEFMFGQSVFNQPLDNWDVSNVTNMGFMFFLTPFNQNISGWCVEQIATEPDNFNDGDSIDPQNKPLWGEPC